MDTFSKQVLDCTSERDVSIQRNIFNGLSSGVECDQEFVGSENCLYLNIYTPQIDKNLSKKFPVMIWIHGGLYMMGSGNSKLYAIHLQKFYKTKTNKNYCVDFRRNIWYKKMWLL